MKLKTIYIGADHRGLALKTQLKTYLTAARLDKVEDVGAFSPDPQDDFANFAIKVAQFVSEHPDERGILICRNGVGMDIVANKFKNVRATIGFDKEQVRLARNDDNINVLALASDFVTLELAQELVQIFLDTPYEAHARQQRRLAKISSLEEA